MPTYNDMGLASRSGVAGSDTRTVFGQVMGLVALTVGFTALGGYLGRNMTGGGLLFFIGALACVVGLNVASARGREQLAIGLLFGLGLTLGLAVAPVLNYYAKADPSALYNAAGVTALFVAACGSFGYATSRDLAAWGRVLFFALLALIVFGLIAIFVSIPHSEVIYCVLGLVIFGGFTIFDFNRLRHRGNMQNAVPIAAGIFLDIFNVFLLLLRLFGGSGGR